MPLFTRAVVIGLVVATTGLVCSTQPLQAAETAPRMNDQRFQLAEHAIDRIVETVKPEPGSATPANDDRISQVVETVRGIVADTLATDAKANDSVEAFCVGAVGLGADGRMSATTAATGIADPARKPELAFACADYLLARIRLAKITVQSQTEARALRDFARSIRRTARH